MTSHDSILAWEMPWTEELDSRKESDTTERLNNNNKMSSSLGGWRHTHASERGWMPSQPFEITHGRAFQNIKSPFPATEIINLAILW